MGFVLFVVFTAIFLTLVGMEAAYQVRCLHRDRRAR